ncbi:hypothetical protein DRJ22_06150, partial [Candidatus Woesearchaeota archaeon]
VKMAPQYKGLKGLKEYATTVIPIAKRVGTAVMSGLMYGNLEKNKLWNFAQEYIPHKKNMSTLLTTEHASGGKLERGISKIFGKKLTRKARKLYQKMPGIIEAQEEANNVAILLSFAEKAIRKETGLRGGILLDRLMQGDKMGMSEKVIKGIMNRAALDLSRVQGHSAGWGGKSEAGYKMQSAITKNDSLMPLYLVSKMFTTYPSSMMQSIVAGMSNNLRKGTTGKLDTASSVLSPMGMVMMATFFSYAMPQAAFRTMKGDDKAFEKAFGVDKIIEVSLRDLGLRNSVMSLSFMEDIKNLLVNPSKGFHGLASKGLPAYFNVLRTIGMMSSINNKEKN